MAGGYGKRPLWQWVLIYIVIGGIVYGLVYYFVFAKNSTYNYGTSQQAPSTAKPSVVATKNTVVIANYAYSPQTLNVHIGDTVTWTNQDSAGHSATADDGSFDTGVLSQGQSGTATFTKAGQYAYHCSVHPNMQGTIIVQ